MMQETIFIIVIIFVVILAIKWLSMQKLEHLTPTSDEAIQNVASLYNKDQLTITNLTATGNTSLNNTTIKNADTIKTGKLFLGDKWLFSGVGDAGSNDDWLRLLKTDGTNAYYGGLAAGRLYDARIGDLSTAVTNLQNQINNLNGALPTCNWAGWNVVCGNCSDNHDDYAMYCNNGKITAINVGNNSNWGYNNRTLPGQVYPW